MRWRKITTVLIVGYVGCASVLAATPRVGILSDEATRSQADLVMIDLSQEPVELVERDEVERVLQEQGLAAAGLTRDNSMRIGRLLKANGLILLQQVDSESFSVRLVAVSPGVIVCYEEFNFPGKEKGPNLEEIARALAGLLKGYFPKLLVERDAAVPISLLRVKVDVGMDDSASVADDLTRLLRLRLVREPALFVLERDNLMWMEEEQRWAGEVSDFWLGNYVIGGAIARTAVKSDMLQCRISMAPPAEAKKAGARNVEFIETIAPGDLAGYADRAVTNFCAHLGKSVGSTPWDPLEEARAVLAAGVSPGSYERRISNIETAMALGLNDIRTARLYCETMLWEVERSARVRLAYGSHFVDEAEKVKRAAGILLKALRFCNSYASSGHLTEPERQKWLKMCVVVYGGTTGPLQGTGVFIEALERENRAADVGDTLEPLLVEAGRLAGRVWFNDEWLDAVHAQPYYIPYARCFFRTSSDIVRLFKWYAQAQPEKGGAREYPPLRRHLINPVFPSSAEDTKAFQDKLWQAFLTEVGASDDPGTQFSLLEGNYVDAATFDERRALRRRMHQHLCDHPEWAASAYPMSSSFVYPRLSKKDGAYWWTAYGEQPEKVSGMELREFATDALAFLLMVLEYRPLMPMDDGFTIGSYWDVLTLDEARTLLVAVRKNGERFKDVGGLRNPAVTSAVPEESYRDGSPAWLRKQDIHTYAQGIVDRFPELKDTGIGKELQRETALAAEERKARVQGNRLIEWQYTREPPGAKPTNRRFRGCNPYWKDGQLWFHHYGDVLKLDPERLTVEKLGSFEFPGSSATEQQGLCAIRVTDTYCVFMVPSLTVGQTTLRRNTRVAVLRREGGPWHTVDVAAQVAGVAEADGMLYLLTMRMSEDGSKRGLQRLDGKTMELQTVLDPLTMEDSTRMAQRLTRVRDSSVEGRAAEMLGYKDGELLLCVDAWKHPPFFAWNIKTKTWRELPKADWLSAQDDQNPYVDAAHAFGFEFVAGGNSQDAPALLVCKAGDPKTKASVPLECGKGLEIYYRAPILTKDSFLLSLPGDEPGFCVVPYADVRKWLEQNTSFYGVANGGDR